MNTNGSGADTEISTQTNKSAKDRTRTVNLAAEDIPSKNRETQTPTNRDEKQCELKIRTTTKNPNLLLVLYNGSDELVRETRARNRYITDQDRTECGFSVGLSVVCCV